MRRGMWIAGILTLLLVGRASPAAAAAPSGRAAPPKADGSPAKAAGERITKLHVAIWPEYDDPRVLVMYDGEFAQAPTDKVRLAMPRGAEIAMAGLVTPEGQHRHQPFDIAEAGDQVEVSFDLPGTRFYVEFYYNPLKGEARREFSFPVKLGAPVDSLQVDVQQPLRATDFAIKPPVATVVTDNQGFRFHRNQVDKLEAGKPFAVTVAYTKSDNNPSVKKQTPGHGDEAADKGKAYRPIIVLSSVGVSVLLALGGYWYVTGRHQGPRAAKRSRGKGGRFCPSCGVAVDEDDHFCAGCGKRLRKRA